MAEAWDWRQSYLQYSDTREDQGLPYPAPQAPEVTARAHQASLGGRGL
ncbi:MAG: hypothetical protein QOD01_2110, partial [Actinomycetota bacterium]|nr:hypothetical protein [Actinomycetota bacterium]